MLKELRELRITDRAKMQHIFNLQSKGLLKSYVNDKGYKCYDTDELKNLKLKRVGRPCKVD